MLQSLLAFLHCCETSIKLQSFVVVHPFSIWIQTCSSLRKIRFPYLAVKFPNRTTDFQRNCSPLPSWLRTLFHYPANGCCRPRAGFIHCYSWGSTDRGDYAPRTERFLFCRSRTELISHAHVKVSLSELCPLISYRTTLPLRAVAPALCFITSSLLLLVLFSLYSFVHICFTVLVPVLWLTLFI